MAAKLKKGDKVVVLTGKDKGKSAEILQILVNKNDATKNKALVSGLNLVRRHTKQTATNEAGIISKEAPIHLSNLSFADPKDGKPTRVGFKIVDGAKQRIAKRSGEVING